MLVTLSLHLYFGLEWSKVGIFHRKSGLLVALSACVLGRVTATMQSLSRAFTDDIGKQITICVPIVCCTPKVVNRTSSARITRIDLMRKFQTKHHAGREAHVAID